MAEPTLASTIDDIRESCRRYLAYGRANAHSYHSDMEADVDECITRGLNQFYFPAPISGEMGAHVWTFLRPTILTRIPARISSTTSGASTTTITAASAVFPDTTTIEGAAHATVLAGQEIRFSGTGNEYTLVETTPFPSTTTCTVDLTASEEPTGAAFTLGGDYSMLDTFGGIDGDIYFADTTVYQPIEITAQHQLYSARQDQSNTQSQRPRIASVKPRTLTTTSTQGQRFSLMLWPYPDANYNIQFRMYYNPNAPSLKQFVLGGMAHYETARASCLAIAEELVPDQNSVKQREGFLDRLAASVAIDRRANSAERLGYNVDTSDWRHDSHFLSRRHFVSVTHNGTAY